MKAGKKRVLIFIGILAVIGIAFTIYFYRTQTVWIDSAPYNRESKEPAKTLVVVYSRTGNTMGAAKEAAKYFDADLLKIKAPQYSRDFKGQMLAVDDADKEVTTTPINHKKVDLSEYELIVLCSPTWWFRPAPPLWSFVENHDFDDKPVFLMMTGNSRLKPELIKKFSNLVETKNGKFIDNLFIQRGRIYWQKNQTQINEELHDALNTRKNLWP